MRYTICSKCGRKGVYFSNKPQVERARQKGLGAWKVYKCKYCGHIQDRIWKPQYRPFG